MINICKNCKFWDSNDGICDEIKNKIEAELVTGWDGGYVKNFLTDEDFGCVLWEEKKAVT